MNNKTVKKLMFLAMAALAVHAGITHAQEATAEQKLTEIFRINILEGGRNSLPVDTYLALKKEGYIAKKKNSRADYTDYYLLKKPIKFLGHEVILLEDEYPSKYIGCCVSPGLGAIVKVNGNVANLNAYAKANKCTLEDKVDVNGTLRSAGLKISGGKEHYAYLSCRERDIPVP